MLRNTDNPVDGSVNASYPVKGGGYFDVISFHYYPMYDLRYVNSSGQTIPTRYSDAAVDQYIARKNTLNAVLESRGYNGITYPEKVFINTENNVPRKSFNGYIGSDEAQRNYDIKAPIASQLHNIRQWYIFSIADNATYDAATDPFQVVGLYQPLAGNPPYNQQPNNSGIAYKTMSDLLNGFKADTDQTKALNLPANVRGGAFKNALGDYMYVLWAATSIDNSEAANAVYAFPAAVNTPAQVYQRSWDYSATNYSPMTSSQAIALTGAPSFISSPLIVTALKPDSAISNPAAYFSVNLYPNPVKNRLTIKLHLRKKEKVSIKITNSMGQPVIQAANNTLYETGDDFIYIPLPASITSGIYYCRLTAGNNTQTIKFIVTK